jgi:nucleoside-diphosphate-sugar epimerase
MLGVSNRVPFSSLLGNLPNTYAYSKNLTEQLVSDYSSKFPIAIARPSIGNGTL